MKLFSKRITACLTAILLTLTSLWAFAGTVISAETIPDDPNDGIITANERKTDLLNETLENVPKVNAASYILYDATSGTILLGKDYDVQKEPASMTKVMTILLALERLQETDIVMPYRYTAVNLVHQRIDVCFQFLLRFSIDAFFDVFAVRFLSDNNTFLVAPIFSLFKLCHADLLLMIQAMIIVPFSEHRSGNPL